MLCGDEVKAAVVDIGSVSSKFGTAGEDLPRHVFRSDIGLIDNHEGSSVPKKVVGDVSLRYVRDNVEIENVVTSDGTINYDHYEVLLRHGLEDCMRVDPTEYPLFLSNSNHADFLKSSEKMMELCFESISSPSMYIGTGGMLSSFSTGRPTSLVIDFGAREIRIVPIVDGYTLSRGIVTTSRGGNWIDHCIQQEMEKNNIIIHPW